jgi:hypothetical protein
MRRVPVYDDVSMIVEKHKCVRFRWSENKEVAFRSVSCSLYPFRSLQVSANLKRGSCLSLWDLLES